VVRPSVKVNRSQYAILGLLAEEPSSGYDIRKKIEKGLSHFWNESYGQIYPILKKLASERLASSKRRKQKGRPDRQVYTITAKGRTVLEEWLREPASLQVQRNETLLKLFFSGIASAAQRRRLIEAYREEQSSVIKECSETKGHLEEEYPDHPHLPLWLMTVDHGRSEARARLRWCDSVLEKLEAPKKKARG
jgi:PadR family transcriptional regulator, regulatory protein AphA